MRRLLFMLILASQVPFVCHVDNSLGLSPRAQSRVFFISCMLCSHCGCIKSQLSTPCQLLGEASQAHGEGQLAWGLLCQKWMVIAEVERFDLRVSCLQLTCD